VVDTRDRQQGFDDVPPSDLEQIQRCPPALERAASFRTAAVDPHVRDHEAALTILRPAFTFILAAIVLDAVAVISARTFERCENLGLGLEPFDKPATPLSMSAIAPYPGRDFI
jgi:hypothetical protein